VLGGAFPSAATLAGDYAPQRLRVTLIMATFTGAPFGGFVGGLIVFLLLARGFGWPVIFILGGAFPLVLLPMLALWLPESPRFLAQKANLSWRQAALLDPPASHVPDRQDPSISAAEDTRGRSPACLVALTATFEQLGQRQQFRLEAIGRLSLAGAGHAHVIDNQLEAGVALGNLADGRQKHRCAEYHRHLGALGGGPQPVEGIVTVRVRRYWDHAPVCRPPRLR
jgi:MFS family permease